jgi:hypothetical protein
LPLNIGLIEKEHMYYLPKRHHELLTANYQALREGTKYRPN